MHYTNLYQWEVVEVARDEQMLYEMERLLLEHDYKTRIETLAYLASEGKELKRFVLPPHIDGVSSQMYGLLVPSKDAEVVRALLTGEVQSIIDVPKDKYYVFSNDLSPKREKKSWQHRSDGKRNFRSRYYMYMGFLIVILLIVFKYMAR